MLKRCCCVEGIPPFHVDLNGPGWFVSNLFVFWLLFPHWITLIWCGASQHGLSSKKMVLITSDCVATRSLSIKWP